jgi:cytoskeleton protein RodZ
VQPAGEAGDVVFLMEETIGRQLQQARLNKGLTIEKVVQATRIRPQYLEALEADDFERLPSPVQARAFLRLYAEFLGLSLDELIAQQRSGQVPDQPKASPPAPAASEQESEAGPQSTQTGLLVRLRTALASRLPVGRTSRTRREAQPAPAPETAPSPARVAAVDAGAAALAGEAVELPPRGPKESQLILQEIGVTLRQRREALSLTFDEVERHTRVRMHYLQALESGQYASLPSSVQARGMLSNYARFLDLDADAILFAFAEALQAQRLERQPAPEPSAKTPAGKTPFRIHLPSPVLRFLSMDILVGGILVLLLLVFAIWGTTWVMRTRSDTTPPPTAPSISDILINTPFGATGAPAPTLASGTFVPSATQAAALEITLPAASSRPVQVVVVAVKRAWVRVTVDGRVKFEELVDPGATYPYDANQQIEVLTGDGSAINILYNQSDLGLMGLFGEVVDRIYTANAILNPTPTFTSTPSITPLPSATLRPSLTPRTTATPRASATPGASPTLNP